MDKLSYLRLAVKNKTYYRRSWIISIMTITRASTAVIYPYKIIRTESNVCFVDPSKNNELTIIEGVKVNDTLFTFQDTILLTKDECLNIKEPCLSTLGNWFCNLICIVEPFGEKFPYINEEFNVGKIEQVIANKLKDDLKEGETEDVNSFYVTEYEKFTDSLPHIKGLIELTSHTLSEKSVTPPPGIEEYKQKLLAELKGDINDPVLLAEVENKLREFSNNHMKDDPSFGKFYGGKISDISNKRIFGIYGADKGFGETPVVVTNSLVEGYDLSKHDQIVSVFNGIRAGSVSRGKDTVKGGVSFKDLLRSMDAMRITEEDCGTQKGLKRTFTKGTINQLVGRYVLINKVAIEIKEENKNNFIDKEVEVRSFQFCQTHSEVKFCKVCSGKQFSNALPGAGAIAVTDNVSSEILTASLKAMHGKVLTIKKLDLFSVLT